jgi:IMP dehydrogenase
MAQAMWECSGLGILHRYAPPETIYQWVTDLTQKGVPAIPSVGVQVEDMDYAKTLRQMGVKVVCLDIAHGHSTRAIKTIEKLKNIGFTVIAGNVATHLGTIELVRAGADVIKCGIGPGSLCTTRIVTGHGVPQLTAIMECAKAKDSGHIFHLIADGGLRSAGDIVKAVAAGADAVMVGRLFAGCKETPSPTATNFVTQEGFKVYRGMASFSAQMSIGHNNDAPEGEQMFVKTRGSVKDVIKELIGGLRSGCSYSGAKDLVELKQNAVFIKVSPNTVKENGAHGLT